MNLKINDDVKEKFSELRIAFFIYSDPIAYDSVEEASLTASGIAAEVREKYDNQETISNHYLNDLYDIFYSKMGLRIKEVSTPLKQASRFLKSEYKSKNRIIDACMKIEYLTGVSFQLYDADKIGEATLQYSIVSDELTLSAHGEVIHTPSKGNDPRFSLDENTRKVLIRLMGVPGIKENDWNEAITKTLELGARALL